ncbi:MAG: CotH kinase family protein, partial [Deltaproteobacteria bacterium]|nr:CotH kinase family protein [Deltaproteobacteria bacterium]
MRRRVVLLPCAVPLVLGLACIRDDGGIGEEDPAPECAFFAPVEAPAPRTEPDWDKASLPLFDETTIPEVRIAFPPSERQALEAIWKDPKWEDPANAELWEVEKADAWVQCSVAVGFATLVTEAACRLRGSPEDWHLEKKPQLKVRFNRWDESKRFLGMRSFNLEYMRYTAAPVRDRIAMWMFREAGLPAARVNHVHVFIDGEDRGPYMVIEPIDREFLEAWFANPDGNLYEGGYQKETNEDVRAEW